jgi:hypothetical protein
MSDKRQWVLSADVDIIERCRERARELGIPMSRYVCAVLRAWLEGDEAARG